MKNILQINTVSNSGSTGKIVEGIAKVVCENGWKSYIGYGREGNRSFFSEEILIGNKLDFYIHALGTRLTDRHGFFSNIATREFLSKLNRIKPDIIHLHNIHGYYLNIEMLFNYLKKTDIPVVWTLHDCWSYTGHCAYYEISNCQKWKEHCESCPQISSYPKSFLDASKKNFDDKRNLFTDLNHLTIVTPSYWLAKEVQESYLQRYPVKVINNGIDLSVFKIKPTDKLKKKLNLKNKIVILGVASIWEERKGFNEFLKLAQLLDERFIIILVGLSDSQIKRLPQNIIGIKRTENVEELADFYSLADVFFNPTFEDNFPTTNIEAIACGTPVITYNTGGSPEIIDEYTGWVVRQNDLLAVYSILINLKATDEVSFLCRSRAEKLYNRADKFEQYIEVYKNYL